LADRLSQAAPDEALSIPLINWIRNLSRTLLAMATQRDLEETAWAGHFYNN